MKLLFATNLAEPLAVTETVQNLANRLEAELLVLHVYIPTPSSAMPIDPMTGFGDFAAYSLYDPEIEHNIERAEEHEFEGFVKERFTRPIRPALIKGDPGTVILADAEEHDVDLIILGKRHHGRLERLLLGSVTGYVVEQAVRPVLLMPL